MRKSILFLLVIFCVAFVAAQEQLPKWEKVIWIFITSIPDGEAVHSLFCRMEQT